MDLDERTKLFYTAYNSGTIQTHQKVTVMDVDNTLLWETAWDEYIKEHGLSWDDDQFLQNDWWSKGQKVFTNTQEIAKNALKSPDENLVVLSSRPASWFFATLHELTVLGIYPARLYLHDTKDPNLVNAKIERFTQLIEEFKISRVYEDDLQVLVGYSKHCDKETELNWVKPEGIIERVTW